MAPESFWAHVFINYAKCLWFKERWVSFLILQEEMGGKLTKLKNSGGEVNDCTPPPLGIVWKFERKTKFDSK